MHHKGFLETGLTFDVPTSFTPLLFSVIICVCLSVVQGKVRLGRSQENLLVIQVSVCYILKHLEDRKTSSVHICCIWCGIILIFKLQRRTRLTSRSSIQRLKIQMTSRPCNKQGQITLSYLLSAKDSNFGVFKHISQR